MRPARFAAIVLGIVVVGAAVDLYLRYGPRPDIVVSGSVRESASGKGIDGVMVLVNVKASRAGWFAPHGHTGCSGASGVATTDASGRFVYRVALADVMSPPWPASIDVTDVRIYKRGYVESPLPEPPGLGFSPRHLDDLAMVPKTESLRERTETLQRLYNESCLFAHSDNGRVALEREISRDIAETYCRGASADDLSFETMSSAVNLIVSRIEEAARMRNAAFDVNDEERLIRRLRAQVRTSALSQYPWASEGWSAPAAPRPLTREEKDAVCSVFDTKDFLI